MVAVISTLTILHRVLGGIVKKLLVVSIQILGFTPTEPPHVIFPSINQSLKGQETLKELICQCSTPEVRSGFNFHRGSWLPKDIGAYEELQKENECLEVTQYLPMSIS